MPNNILTQLRFIHATESYWPSSDGALVGCTRNWFTLAQIKRDLLALCLSGGETTRTTIGSRRLGPHFDNFWPSVLFLYCELWIHFFPNFMHGPVFVLFGQQFCDATTTKVATIYSWRKRYSQKLAIYTRYEFFFVFKRILLYSWLPTGNYHKNLVIWRGKKFEIWWIWVFFFFIGVVIIFVEVKIIFFRSKFG
jgi:hypothetical protein